MSQLTFFSTHSGAGGACLGARTAGLLPIGGIEIDSYCVDLHRANFGDRIRHESILDTPTEELPDFDFLWTSPSCQSFSTAKTGGKELELDIAIAHKIAEIIRVKKPRYFALENVRGYLNSNSFNIILSEIKSQGYNHHHAIYDVADYGVPQNRHRLILRASREPLHDLSQTHSKTGGLWWKPWNGWYDAIADLLPSCKRSHLTERQIQALEKKGWAFENNSAVLVERQMGFRDSQIKEIDEPIQTILAKYDGGGRLPKAVLAEKSHISYREPRTISEKIPAWSVLSGMDCPSRSPAAVLMNGSLGSETNPGSPVDGLTPSFTITSNDNMLSSRAILVESKQHTVSENVTRLESQPSYTVIADQSHPPRAVIIERTGYRKDRDPMIREKNEPSQTIRAAVGCDERGGYRSPITALLEDADVRALDYRCLARLQSFPDSYVWGKSSGKNCKAIGNAVPSLFAQRVIESIIGKQK